MPKPSKYINDPTLLEQVNLIREGKIDRKTAAENLGTPLTTFASRIARAKMQHMLVDAPKHKNRHVFQPLDPNSPKALAYERAVKRALELHNIKKAFNEINTPELNLNYQLLCRKVAELKQQPQPQPQPQPKPLPPQTNTEESVIDYLKRKSIKEPQK